MNDQTAKLDPFIESDANHPSLLNDQGNTERTPDIRKALASSESFWQQRLARLQPLPLPFEQGESALEPQWAISAWRPPLLEKSEPKQSLTVLLSVLAIYLARLTEQAQYQIGWRVSEMNDKPEMLADLSPVVPMEIAVDLDQPFAPVCHAIEAEYARLEQHHTFLRDLVVRHPTLRSLSALRAAYPWQVAVSVLSDEASSQLAPATQASGALLTLQVKSDGAFRWVYDTHRMDARRVQCISEHLQALCDAASNNVETPVCKLNLLPPAERETLINTWNATAAPYPAHQCLHQVFEEQVRRTPDAIALVYEDQALSYTKLNAQANRLAHRLIELGVQPDTRVALCVTRSPAMVVGLLAILKAGGAYVPLDPAYPSERLTHSLTDSAPELVLADTAGQAALGQAALASRTVLDPNVLPERATTNPHVPELLSSHLAYVIYTSGSTGTPKGVMVEHRSVVNLVQAQINCFDICPFSRILQFASLGFDVNASETFIALNSGASLYLPPDTARHDRNELWRYLEKHAITYADIPPALLQAGDDLPHLNTPLTLILGGEAPSATLLRNLVRQGAVVFNAYGPTETTICSTVWRGSQDFNGEVVPIGRPLDNTQIYLLDAHGQPVPLGAVGELYIGGVGVARGYLNRTELTAERFVTDPFCGVENARMYKTGDLARYLPDGNLVFLGRNDHQIKIRGFRIEPGEIEARLREHPQVRDAAVLTSGDGGAKRLIAYVVAECDEQLANTLRAHLLTSLPEYMVPAAFVRLDAFPLTPSGKLDRRALPAPHANAFARQAYEAPQGEAETALAAIWAELLGLSHIGRHDSFFALGGNSLLAVQMIDRLRRVGLMLSVRALFETPTLSVLAQSLGQHREVVVPPNRITPDTITLTPEQLPLIELTQADIDRIVTQVPGGIANIQDIYALSPLQDGILFHHLLAADRDPYLLTTQMAFANRQVLDRYLEAVQQVVNRHDILRTAFAWEGLSVPAQVVWRHASLAVTELKLNPDDGPVIEQLLRRFDPSQYRIDLTRAPLLHFAIAQDGDGRWLLLELLHHLIGDHATQEIMQTEVQAFLEGRGDALPPARPFRNLVAQARLGISESEHARFFTEMLADVDEPTLPFGLADVHRDGTHVTESHRMLPQDLNDRLRTQAKQLGVSLASLCHLAWAQVLARVTGQQQVVFGTVLFGRMQAGDGADSAMGLFINTLPLRVDLNNSVQDGVRHTHARLATLLEHEHASLGLAQRCSGVPAGTPLFSALLNYVHEGVSPSDIQTTPGIEFLGTQERDNYPLGLSVEDRGHALGLTAQAVQLLDPDRICGYMQQALESLAAALEHTPSLPVQQLNVLPANERTLLLETWNATPSSAAHDGVISDVQAQMLHRLFEAQADKTPHAVAIVFEQQQCSYQELNTRANQLAHYLRTLGVGPEVVAGVYIERSIDMLVGVLGILKAGGAYLPLDPNYPAERIAYMLDNANVSVLITQSHLEAQLPDMPAQRVHIDTDWARMATQPHYAPQSGVGPHHLAYVIYTSGSTGRPKGVMVDHYAVSSRLHAGQQLLSLRSDDHCLQQISLSFDASIEEIFIPLMSGATLVMADPTIQMDASRLATLMARQRISVIDIAPAMLEQLCATEGVANCRHLRLVLCGAEALSSAVLHACQTTFPNATLYNLYGPTEGVVNALAWRATQLAGSETPPLGGPIANTRVYVLDRALQPVPIGVTGELYIGGPALARAYLGRPDLTAERFIANPFEQGTRLYRTGDLVRWRADGQLEYLGRADHQIKLRGFRIELSEIESVLAKYPGIAQATLSLREDRPGNKQLVAYWVTAAGHTVTPVELKFHLGQILPSYMMPAAFVELDALPLTANGKIDRQALPAPDFSSSSAQAPRTAAETLLADLFAEILGLDTVGIDDNFFDLGGHSLLAMRLISRIRAALDIDIAIRTLFEAPTVADLAQRLTPNAFARPPLRPQPRPATLPLSFAQRRLWFTHQFEGPSATYNMPLPLRLFGTVDTHALQAALNDLLARHESLRTVFKDINGVATQQIIAVEAASLTLETVQVTAETLSQRLAQAAVHHFDLSREIPLRAWLFQLDAQEHVLLLLLHHIAGDGWSMAPLARDLGRAYAARLQDRAPDWAPLPVQYADYTLWQQALFGNEHDPDSMIGRQFAYWERTLAGLPDRLELPFDRARPSVASYHGDYVAMRIDAALHGKLQALARTHEASLFMVLQAALATLLTRLGAGNDIPIGTAIAGRTDEALDELIGFFVNTLVLRTDTSGHPSFNALLKRVRETCLAAYAHQDAPFEQLVERLNPTRSTAHHPLFQVSLVLQNTAVQPFDLPGLRLIPEPIDTFTAKFDLFFSFDEVPSTDGGAQGLEGLIEYATDLFDRDTVDKLARRFIRLLEAIADAPAQSIGQIDLLETAERQQLLNGWNDTAQPICEATLPALFEAQEAKAPDAIALVFEDQHVSYAELNAQANRLAHYLIAEGIGPEDIVALALPRSPQMISALLGILKAGAAYLPLDPDYPRERLAFMLEDAQPKRILTHASSAKRLPHEYTAVLHLDHPAVYAALTQLPESNPSDIHRLRPLSPRHPAYVIYTSGSTGKPKGVVVTHAGSHNLTAAQIKCFSLSPNSRVLQFASLSFDAAFWELCMSLLSGATLVLGRSEQLLPGDALAKLTSEQAITHVTLPPSALAALPADSLTTCSHLIVAGEACPPHLVEQWSQARHMTNAYGPTEATVCAAMRRFLPGDAVTEVASSIGRPIDNTQLYVLDDHLQPVPAGVSGELYIGGIGLARGYLNRPDLTAERFVAAPFGPAGVRLYRTGDLARWRADGTLDFLGRADHQVKLRGFRIEPGEIEAVLCRHPAVAQAAVIAREDRPGHTQLVGYVTLDKTTAERNAATEERQVGEWQTIYDTHYGSHQASAFGENFVGWDSSYDGRPIPLPDMQAWRAATVARIQALKPRRLLEIGVGSGLLLAHLAPHCEAYWGTDFSMPTIEALQAQLTHYPELASRVELRTQAAHVTEGLPSGYFDTIVINSVAQYFPNVSYLQDVLHQAVALLAPGGVVFIGDVRNFNLLNCFVSAVQLHQANPAVDDVSTLRRRIEQALLAEKELLLAPAFFSTLPRTIDTIAAVDIQLKRGPYENELSRYRYDVVLHKQAAEPIRTLSLAQAPQLYWGQQLVNLDTLKAHLNTQHPTRLRIVGVPNARLEREIKAMQALEHGCDIATVQHRLKAGGTRAEGLTPDDFHALGQACGYWVAATWSGDAQACMDILLVQASEAANAAFTDLYLPLPALAHQAPGAHANNPAKLDQLADIRRYAASALPAYMVPAAMVLLDNLPLTPNGKLDRKALPAPDFVSEHYRAARSPQEQTLAELFAEVLGLPRVGIDDRFFDLGGHSLLATRLISRIRTTLGVEVPIRTLFEAASVAELAPRITAMQQNNELSIPALTVQPRPDALPLSFAQERLWFLDQLGQGDAYQIPMATRLTGQLDVPALNAALSEIVRRHEALRTRFEARDGTGVQVIDPPWTVALKPRELEECELVHYLQASAEQPFNLATGPLARFELLRLASNVHVLSIVLHHIISDGWSIGVLTRELNELYSAFVQGQPSPLPELPVQYADYALWQRAWLKDEALERELNYWRKQLAGAPAALELPTDRPRPAMPSGRGHGLAVHVPAALAAQLKALAQREGATLYMTLLTAFQIVLSRWSGQDDIVVGSPIAGRTQAQTEGLLGFFLNTLALRTDLSGNPCFNELLAQVRETALEAYAYQAVPFEKLVEVLQRVRDLSRAPIVQVMVNGLNLSTSNLALPGLIAEPVQFDTFGTKFDLTLYFGETSDGIDGWLQYATDLFDADTIARLGQHWVNVLEAVAANPAQRLSELPLLSAAEQRQLLTTWNDTAADYPDTQTLHQLFEVQAQRAPHAVAAVCEAQQMTYAELDTRANQLAHHLRTLGVGPEVIVGLCVERSLEMLVGILGILKAGGAYAPLDPSYPPERLAYMLEEASAPVLVTQAHLEAPLPATDARRVRLDADWHDIATQPHHTPHSGVTPAHLAYVIYTSGSTGRPKGVMIRHRGVANYLAFLTRHYRLTAADVVLNVSGLAFDPSVRDLFGPLTSGGRAVLVPTAQAKEPHKYLSVIQEQRVTKMLSITPSFLRSLCEAAQDRPLPQLALQAILTCGEPLEAALCDRARQVFGAQVAVINQYGPTECTLSSTWFAAVPQPSGIVPIGRAISNARVYVLDRHLQLAPPGVVGELYIASVGLARGYFKRPALSAERFIANPFGHGERLYRTGDLAKWRADGQLQYLGRTDHQVKIRGIRVELGEIETQLLALPSIHQAVVVAREDEPGEKRLVAYFVSDDAIDTTALRDQLKGSLPDYMVPSAFVRLDTMPLTPNNKVDRQALPAPNFISERYRAPRSPQEQTLTELVAEVLGLPRVGIDDNFFELGGHSLLAMRFAARVQQALGAELPVRALFEAPTIAELTPRLHALRQSRDLNIPALTTQTRPTILPLSFAQERLWFLEQLGQGAAYQIPIAMRLTGKLDVAALAAALSEIVRRHETLRTRFETHDGDGVQVVNPPWTVELIPHEVAEHDVMHDLLAAAQQPFDLTAGPLVRFALLRLAPDTHVLSVILHHIISDGWSLGVLTREIQALYTAFSQKQGSPLPELAVQYADYALWQRAWLKDEALERELNYWRKQLAGAPAALELPTDRPRPAVPSGRGHGLAVHVPAALATQLKTLAQRECATLYMTLLAAFQVVLSRWSGQDDIVVGSPIAGRTQVQTEALIGFFINTLALRTDLSGNPRFNELLAQVRETTLGAYAHQAVPFEKLVEVLQPVRDLSRQPIFQVMVNGFNVPMSDFTLPGLTVEKIDLERLSTKFDLTLSFGETSDGIDGWLQYATDLFDADTIERLGQHWVNVLEAVAANPVQCLSELPLLGATERHQLLTAWNDTAADFSSAPILHQLFEAQVQRTPNAIAAVFETQQMTYAELDQRANQLAHHLRAMGVGPEVIVGLCAERSLQMLVGLLGILKAGGAYLPLDPSYPAERIAYMLEDAQVAALVLQPHLKPLLPATRTQTVTLEKSWAQIATQPSTRPTSVVRPRNLAYITYTSGSTGRPKGVMTQHSGAANYLNFLVRHYRLTEADVVLNVASLAFDASVRDLLGPLVAGAQAVLIPTAQAKEPHQYVRAINEHGVTKLLSITPSLLRSVCQVADGPQTTPTLRTILTSGEALEADLCTQVHQTLSEQINVVNQYGPTECTMTSTWFAAVPQASGIVPIGRPLSNARVYLLDRYFQPVPCGVAGELYIAGAGLTRGYVNQPALSAERFIANPFGQGERLYRTGDLAKWRADGQLEYLGRTDHQVKIRGFRVELEEISAALAGHPDVAQATVIAREDDRSADKRLVAYLVAAANCTITPATLRQYLSQKLPDYMIPAVFVVLDALPLTPNGKVDRKALPEPEMTVTATARMPRTPEEQVLCELFAEVLGVAHVGIDDNFFELGGHSLLAARLIHRVRTTLGLELSIRNLFETPTVAGLSQQPDKPTDVEPLFQVVLPLRSHGDRLPIFCIHPAGELGWCYAGLLRYVDRQHPLYSLQARCLSAPGPLPETIEEMALDYVEQIRRIQPSGPYQLVGWSLGGLIAFEMACILQKEGEHVALLALLDSYVRTGHKPMRRVARQDMIADLLAEAGYDSASSEKTPLDFDERREILRKGGSLYAALDERQFDSILDFFEKTPQMIERYVPRSSFEGDVLHIKAALEKSGYRPEPETWQAYVKGHVEMHSIDCEHGAMMQPEPLAQIGPIIAQKLSTVS
ncbi:non-ribosomal peptide synthase/polyketide synthase [Mycetohabitans sp. B8]|uniref:non-ribosomal peptide synthase/polyketide synthase n=1 Tax=Mycetohabitans sp. B8 TaxID=2841845 RepID=UPI001EFFC2DC|nr:non-ribosomal peptide synthase/polyketide synthase [Mycetohabitans sp. B8]MCG1042707.1 non-ribosomal peptide synthase/polyketide synthase [Mycetohabitans sp. B8]